MGDPIAAFRWAIVGPGALGLLFAARLKLAGESVVLIDYRPDRAKRLRRDGIRLIEGDQEQRLEVPASLPGDLESPPTFWLVCVKATATEAAADDIRAAVPPEGIVVTLQNGIGNGEILAARFGAERVLIGTTTEGATLVNEGVVRHAGRGKTRIAPLVPASRERVVPVVKRLRAAGFCAEVADDWQRLVWEKAVVNAAINPLTALLEVPNGRLLEWKEVREVLRGVAEEAAQIAQAVGVPLDSAAVERVEAVCRATAENRSSMLQDILQGRRTELEAVNGRLLAEAHRRGVRAPVLETVTQLAAAKERLAQERVSSQTAKENQRGKTV